MYCSFVGFGKSDSFRVTYMVAEDLFFTINEDLTVNFVGTYYFVRSGYVYLDEGKEEKKTLFVEDTCTIQYQYV